MKTRFTHLTLAACLIVFFAYLGRSPCFGQGTIYTDRSAFDAAIVGLAGTRHDVNFQPPFPPGGIDEGDAVRYGPSLTISGLTFRSGGPMLLRRVSADANVILNNYDSLTPLFVDMNGPARAFGADFASLLTPFYSNFLATVTLDNGNVFTFTAPANPNLAFYGFVTTQPFSRVTFSDGGLIFGDLHEEILDNVTAVTVPEPNVVALFALGALLLRRRWRRKGKQIQCVSSRVS